MDKNKEREILELLEQNSRYTTAEIASLLGESEMEVAQAIARLVADRVIVKYHTIINWEKFGDDAVSAMIDVKITPQRDKGYDAVARRIYRYPEVKSVFLMSGAYDLAVLIEGRTLKEVALFVAEKLATLEDVQSTTTHFVLKKYKQAGVILDEDAGDDERLVVSP
ncbi:MAG: Lrp/AsnC family transcriptional regulator [Bacillota bacterium]